MIKRALVLGGGGTRGAYQVGVWKALKELGIKLDIVTGTSIGALNGALIVQDDYEACTQLWDDMRFEKILTSITEESFATFGGAKLAIKSFLKEILKDGGMDIEPLELTIKALLDEDKIMSSEIDFGLVTVQIPSLKETALIKQDIPKGMMADYLLASAACFPAFKPRDINDARYIDGGYRNNLPMDIAVDLGANEIIAVDLEGFVFNNIPKVQNVPVRYIKSYWSLGLFLNVDKDKIQRNIALGYLDTLRSFGTYEGLSYAFILGTKKSLHEKSKNLTVYMEDQLGISVLKTPSSQIEKLARHRMITALNKYPKARVNMEEYSLRACELAAELMEIDPSVVYTYESINEEIKKAFNSERNISISFKDIEDAISTPKSVAAVTRLLGTYEKKEIVSFIYKYIDKSINEKNRDISIKILAAISSKEFIAAAYIYAVNKLSTKLIKTQDTLLLK